MKLDKSFISSITYTILILSNAKDFFNPIGTKMLEQDFSQQSQKYHLINFYGKTVFRNQIRLWWGGGGH